MTAPSCVFCPANNLLKVDVIASSEHAYLIPAYSSPGNYLIAPKAHAESVLGLPDTWWNDVKQLLARVPDLPEHYNISINLGAHAGQTVQHIHFWVIPRAEGDTSTGKGLASLISEADQD